MSKTKQPKWYVVWNGVTPGVYHTWADAKQQIDGFSGARFKSYESLREATAAFAEGAPTASAPTKKRVPKRDTSLHTAIVTPSFAVDAACDMTTGVMEYRGVDVETGAEIFRMGPYQDSSNNLGEFLAIVHCLAFCKQRGLSEPIYTDSRTALSWLRNRKAKTTVVRTHGNAVVFDLIARAEVWLEKNTYPNVVQKWDTKAWGENPADFGRK